jgi:hypothetical protein
MDIKLNEVYSFKLVSSEEIVAKVLEIGSDYLLLEEPVSITTNGQGMGLIPTLFTSEPQSKIRLNTSSIALTSVTADTVKLKYLEATTGIKVPTKKLVLG